MEFLESHWHCVLPLAGILIGAILLNRGGAKERKNERDAGPEPKKRIVGHPPD